VSKPGYAESKEQLQRRLARIEGQVALSALVQRFGRMELEPGPLVWRQNLGLRGLEALAVSLGGAP